MRNETWWKACAGCAWAVVIGSCGHVADDNPAAMTTGGTTGSGGSGDASGGRPAGTGGRTLSTGGSMSTGGVLFAAGGADASTGGQPGETMVPENGVCGDLPEDLVLEPPCSSADVVMPATCNYSLWFTLSLADLDPAASDELKVALLDPAPPGGFAGASQGQPPFVLEVQVLPETAGTSTGRTFRVTQPDAYAYARLPYQFTEYGDYLQELASSPFDSYYEATVAVLHRDAVLLQRRMIMQQPYPCLVR